MHLINQKLGGQELPASLPNSLVPPSLRQEFGGGQQEVLDNGPSSTTQDLFDLFADEPAPMATQPSLSGSQPQPFAAGAFAAQPPLSNQNTGQQAPQSRQLSPTPTGTRGFVPQSAFGMAAIHTGKCARQSLAAFTLLTMYRRKIASTAFRPVGRRCRRNTACGPRRLCRDRQQTEPAREHPA